MYLLISAYDTLDVLTVRVVCTDEISADGATAMHVGWKATATVPIPTERAWPDLVALVAETALDLAYDRR